MRPGLQGVELSGRPAIGATVRVVRPDGRVLVGQVDGGNGHSGVRSPELHFGLGDDIAESIGVSIHYRDRFGREGSIELDLESGWHSVLLPDRPDDFAFAKEGAQ